MNGRTLAAIGAVNGFLAVALGAFGAHGLRGRLGEAMLQVYNTGVDYHMAHALGLVLIGLAARRDGDGRGMNWAGGLMLTGIVLFSGSLYALSITGIGTLGMITPFGGVAFLAGWLVFAVSLWRR